jgi:hypothetical protein
VRLVGGCRPKTAGPAGSPPPRTSDMSPKDSGPHLNIDYFMRRKSASHMEHCNISTIHCATEIRPKTIMKRGADPRRLNPGTFARTDPSRTFAWSALILFIVLMRRSSAAGIGNIGRLWRLCPRELPVAIIAGISPTGRALGLSYNSGTGAPDLNGASLFGQSGLAASQASSRSIVLFQPYL